MANRRDAGVWVRALLVHCRGDAVTHFAIQAAPQRLNYRRSRDDVWPLRLPDGRTFAERKEQEAALRQD